MRQRLGRYEIVRLLGEGGQGRVYEAVLHGPGGVGRRVALKLLPTGAGLVREARIGGLLRHRNLVDVYEVGEADGTWFCAMELCRGGTLADRIPLPPRAVVDVGLQVCAALRYAHEELGLVHLDLKPQNLLLDGAVVKVADLGVARATGFAWDGRAAGTRGYMAPEHARGDAVDARADVYALGVVLSVLSTGHKPARSGTFSIASFEDDGLTHDVDAPEPTTEDVPKGPDWLMPVLTRCVDPDPNGRYASMAELADALAALDVPGPTLREVIGVVEPPPAPLLGTNLGRAERDAFVGRAGEVARLVDRLAEPGVVTLKGPGGIGKTRLAREVARQYRLRTGAQAWFCDLGEARSEDGLLHAVAGALDVPLHGSGDVVAQLGHALAAREGVVVVLDNFEQIVACAPIVERWAARAPSARIVVTSREPLRVGGEDVVEVGVLSEADAVSLLRARALDRGVEPGDDGPLREIARRLGGVPLALELAAGRLGVLSASEVVERLGLSLLRTGRADVADRHETLRGALDWSWDLLSDVERDVLGQLSVFRGGFSLAAAEAVVRVPEGGPWVVDVLHTLVDRSLVRVAGARFDLLVPLQEYAAEKLGARAGEVARRHVAHFVSFGTDDALDALNQHDGPERRASLRRDVDNLVAACRAAIASGEPASASALALAAWMVIEGLGPYGTAFELGVAVEAMAGASADARARAAWVAGAAAVQLGRADAAAAWLDAACEQARIAEDRRVETLALATLATLHRVVGRVDEAADTCRRALDVRGGARWMRGLVLANLGVIHLQQARADEGEGFLLEGLAIAREVGDVGLEGFLLNNVANLHLDRSRFDEARAAYHAALTALRRIGHRRLEAVVLGNLGIFESDRGNIEVALAHQAAALALHRETGDRRSEGHTVGQIGILDAEQGRPTARERLEAALVVHREVGNQRSAGVVLGYLGLLDVEEGRYADARERLDAALASHRAVRHRGFEAIVTGFLGQLSAREGRYDEARALLDVAEARLRELGYRSEVVKVLCRRAECEHLAGDVRAAEAALAEAEQLAGTSIARTEVARRIRDARRLLDRAVG